MNRYVISSNGWPRPTVALYEVAGATEIQVANDFWGGDNMLHLIEATDEAVEKLKNAGWNVKENNTNSLP